MIECDIAKSAITPDQNACTAQIIIIDDAKVSSLDMDSGFGMRWKVLKE